MIFFSICTQYIPIEFVYNIKNIGWYYVTCIHSIRFLDSSIILIYYNNVYKYIVIISYFY